jgi:hypothetical protein
MDKKELIGGERRLFRRGPEPRRGDGASEAVASLIAEPYSHDFPFHDRYSTAIVT